MEQKLAERIEEIAVHWKGTNGGIYTIHAMALEMAKLLSNEFLVRERTQSDGEIAFYAFYDRPRRTWEQIDQSERDRWEKAAARVLS